MENTFDFREAVNNTLKNMGLDATVLYTETNSACFELTEFKHDVFVGTLQILINTGGLMGVTTYLTGLVPENAVMAIKEKAGDISDTVSGIKLYVSQNGIIRMSTESLLPEDEELIEEEITDSFRRMNLMYKNFSDLMILYWNAIKESNM